MSQNLGLLQISPPKIQAICRLCVNKSLGCAAIENREFFKLGHSIGGVKKGGGILVIEHWHKILSAVRDVLLEIDYNESIIREHRGTGMLACL